MIFKENFIKLTICDNCNNFLQRFECNDSRPLVVPWCSIYHYCTTSFNKASIQFLRRFKSCSWRDGDSRWWGSLTMVTAGNKAKRLSSVNYTTKTIHHHHQLNLFSGSQIIQFQLSWEVLTDIFLSNQIDVFLSRSCI